MDEPTLPTDLPTIPITQFRRQLEAWIENPSPAIVTLRRKPVAVALPHDLWIAYTEAIDRYQRQIEQYTQAPADAKPQE